MHSGEGVRNCIVMQMNAMTCAGYKPVVVKMTKGDRDRLFDWLEVEYGKTMLNFHVFGLRVVLFDEDMPPRVYSEGA